MIWLWYLIGLSSGLVINQTILLKKVLKRLQFLLDRNKMEIYIEGKPVKRVGELLKHL